jgi:hypothetical protein
MRRSASSTRRAPVLVTTRWRGISPESARFGLRSHALAFSASASKGAERCVMQVEHSCESIGLFRRQVLAASLAVRERPARDDESRHLVARQYSAIDDFGQDRSGDALSDTSGELDA